MVFDLTFFNRLIRSIPLISPSTVSEPCLNLLQPFVTFSDSLRLFNLRDSRNQWDSAGSCKKVTIGNQNLPLDRV
jgi:hypothetical protein